MVKKTGAKGKKAAVAKKKVGKEEARITVIPKKYRLARPKFIRDPIHDLIRIEDKTILAILDTPPMQRLKGIRQLGAASFVYPGAEHSRFSHSLGVYHIATKMLNQIGESDYRSRLVIQLAALLHDTGHGPFSHLFEAALKEYGYKHYRKHEKWTASIIRTEETIVKILGKVDKKLKKDVADVILGSFEPLYLSSIVSSQVDADRFDYMLRDSHMTGVHYGKFDLNWMLRSMSRAKYRPKDVDKKKQDEVEKLVIDARRGLSSLETYLLGNFYLYKHVYYHKTIQAAEGMLVKILSRALALAKVKKNAKFFDPVLKKIAMHEKLDLSEYLTLTDATILYWLAQWCTQPEDDILNDLCHRFRQRKLFKVVPLRGVGRIDCHKIVSRAEILLSDRGFDPKFYLIQTEPERVAYKRYHWGNPDAEIYYLDEDGKPQQFTSIAGEHAISRAIQIQNHDEYFLVVPRECVADIESIKRKVLS